LLGQWNRSGCGRKYTTWAQIDRLSAVDNRVKADSGGKDNSMWHTLYTDRADVDRFTRIGFSEVKISLVNAANPCKSVNIRAIRVTKKIPNFQQVKNSGQQ